MGIFSIGAIKRKSTQKRRDALIRIFHEIQQSEVAFDKATFKKMASVSSWSDDRVNKIFDEITRLVENKK